MHDRPLNSRLCSSGKRPRSVEATKGNAVTIRKHQPLAAKRLRRLLAPAPRWPAGLYARYERSAVTA